jgi:DNA-binding transcriptional regulator YiaG
MRKVDLVKRTEQAADRLSRPLRPGKTKSFSEEVRELRADLSLTQEQFCKRYNIPLANLRNWEQTSKNIIPDTAARLLIEMIKVDPQRVAKIVEKVHAAQLETA